MYTIPKPDKGDIYVPGLCDYDKCKRRSEPRWVAVEAGGKGDKTDKFIYDADQQPISVPLTTAENE